MIRTLKINYHFSNHFVFNNFNRPRDMIIHHGLMGSSKNFKSLSKHISISKYVNTYLIDARNHGDSPHTKTHTIDDLADDLNNFIKEHQLNKNINKLTLMGHSMGALALMKFTQKYPQMQQAVSRVIIIDMCCSSRSVEKEFDHTGKMLERMSKINLHQSTDDLFKEIQLKAGSKQVAGLMKTNIKILSENSHKWGPNIPLLAKQYENIISFNLNQNKWRKPVQVIYGSKSNLVNPQQISQYIKMYPQMEQNQNFYKVEGAGHWVHFDKTIQFLKIIEHILLKDQQK